MKDERVNYRARMLRLFWDLLCDSEDDSEDDFEYYSDDEAEDVYKLS